MVVINGSVCSTHTDMDHMVTSGAVNMVLVSACMAQGQMTALNKTLINTRPLKSPRGRVCVCVCVCFLDMH